MMPAARLACGLAALLALAACAKDPRDPLQSRPATAALTQDEVAVAPVAAATPAVAVAPAVPPPTIVLAQIGWKLAASGLLERPDTEIPAAAAIHGMAMFRGRQDQQGLVELQVFDAGDRQVAATRRQYTLDGDTAVMLEVRAAGARWTPGQYRALYLCDGKPCWEVRFAVR